MQTTNPAFKALNLFFVRHTNTHRHATYCLVIFSKSKLYYGHSYINISVYLSTKQRLGRSREQGIILEMVRERRMWYRNLPHTTYMHLQGS